MNVEPLEEKYRGFGWDVVRINGHDMKQVVDALENAKKDLGKPLVILADTVKGKGVSFMENIAGWHGKSPSYDEMAKGLEELQLTDRIPVKDLLERAKWYQAEVDRRLDHELPKFKVNYWWNSAANMKA